MQPELPQTPPVDLNAAVAARVLPLAQTLNHALLRVYAHLQPPYSLRDGETYDVDLAQQRFTILHGAQAVFDANLQVLGTYDRNVNVWLWPRANTSIRPEAYHALFTTLTANEACAELLTPNRFSVREDLAFALAAWLAREADCFGVYPAMFNEGLYVFLALDTPVGRGGHGVRTMSCGFCYRRSDACAQIIAVAPDLGVCSDCVRDLEEVVGLEFPDDPQAGEGSEWPTAHEAPETHPTVPCIACGDHGKRVFGSEASICSRCLAMCGEALGAG